MTPINMNNRFGIIKHAENNEPDIGTKLRTFGDEAVNRLRSGATYVRGAVNDVGLGTTLATFGSGALITALILRNIARRKRIKDLENRVTSLEGNTVMNKSAGKIISRLGKAGLKGWTGFGVR